MKRTIWVAIDKKNRIMDVWYRKNWFKFYDYDNNTLAQWKNHWKNLLIDCRFERYTIKI